MNLYQIDAFTDSLFSGNPAAVVPLDQWLTDDLMQRIAEENNLSETAFFVPKDDTYEIRWFTPTTEVDLCGHATLASAWVIHHELKNQTTTLCFSSKSGKLKATVQQDLITLDFPVVEALPCEIPNELIEGLGTLPTEVKAVPNEDYVVVLSDQELLQDITPDWNHLLKLPGRGVIITSPATENEVDFVSRAFYPKYGINEDPVTGSAHTKLIPYWSRRLKKQKMVARQLSKRGGSIQCQLKGDRVLIGGQAVKYLEGNLSL